MCKSTIAQIQKLRRITQAPVSKCKEALLQTDGDVQAAASWLSTHAPTTETPNLTTSTSVYGLVGCLQSASPSSLVMGSLYSASDFVSKTPLFRRLLTAMLTSFAAHGPNAATAIFSEQQFSRLVLPSRAIEDHQFPPGTSLQEALQLAGVVFDLPCVLDGLVCLKQNEHFLCIVGEPVNLSPVHFVPLRSLFPSSEVAVVSSWYVHDQVALEEGDMSNGVLGTTAAFTQLVVQKTSSADVLEPIVSCMAKAVGMQAVIMLDAMYRNAKEPLPCRLDNQHTRVPPTSPLSTSLTKQEFLHLEWTAFPYILNKVPLFALWLSASEWSSEKVLTVEKGLVACGAWLRSAYFPDAGTLESIATDNFLSIGSLAAKHFSGYSLLFSE